MEDSAEFAQISYNVPAVGNMSCVSVAKIQLQCLNFSLYLCVYLPIGRIDVITSYQATWLHVAILVFPIHLADQQ